MYLNLFMPISIVQVLDIRVFIYINSILLVGGVGYSIKKGYSGYYP